MPSSNGNSTWSILFTSLGNPDILASANQARQASHHVLLNMTMKKKITMYPQAACIFRRIMLKLLKSARKPHGGRNLGIGNKGFQRAQPMYV